MILQQSQANHCVTGGRWMVQCDQEGLAVSQSSSGAFAGTAFGAGVAGILLWQEPFCQKLSAKFTESTSRFDRAHRLFTPTYAINKALALHQTRLCQAQPSHSQKTEYQKCISIPFKSALSLFQESHPFFKNGVDVVHSECITWHKRYNLQVFIYFCR